MRFFVEALEFAEGTFTAELDRDGKIHFRVDQGRGPRDYSKNYVMHRGLVVR